MILTPKNHEKPYHRFINVRYYIDTCKKETTQKATIQGSWNIVSDTGSYLNISLSIGNGPYTTKILPGDYFNFAPSGKLYIREQSVRYLDTLNYNVLNDSTINIYSIQNNVQVPWDGYGPVGIVALSAHSLILYYNYNSTFVDADERIVLAR
jgi:hypothetical protein